MKTIISEKRLRAIIEQMLSESVDRTNVKFIHDQKLFYQFINDLNAGEASQSTGYGQTFETIYSRVNAGYEDMNSKKNQAFADLLFRIGQRGILYSLKYSRLINNPRLSGIKPRLANAAMMGGNIPKDGYYYPGLIKGELDYDFIKTYNNPGVLPIKITKLTPNTSDREGTVALRKTPNRLFLLVKLPAGTLVDAEMIAAFTKMAKNYFGFKSPLTPCPDGQVDINDGVITHNIPAEGQQVKITNLASIYGLQLSGPLSDSLGSDSEVTGVGPFAETFMYTPGGEIQPTYETIILTPYSNQSQYNAQINANKAGNSFNPMFNKHRRAVVDMIGNAVTAQSTPSTNKEGGITPPNKQTAIVEELTRLFQGSTSRQDQIDLSKEIMKDDPEIPLSAARYDITSPYKNDKLPKLTVDKDAGLYTFQASDGYKIVHGDLVIGSPVSPFTTTDYYYSSQKSVAKKDFDKEVGRVYYKAIEIVARMFNKHIRDIYMDRLSTELLKLRGDLDATRAAEFEALLNDFYYFGSIGFDRESSYEGRILAQQNLISTRTALVAKIEEFYEDEAFSRARPDGSYYTADEWKQRIRNVMLEYAGLDVQPGSEKEKDLYRPTYQAAKAAEKRVEKDKKAHRERIANASKGTIQTEVLDMSSSPDLVMPNRVKSDFRNRDMNFDMSNLDIDPNAVNTIDDDGSIDFDLITVITTAIVCAEIMDLLVEAAIIGAQLITNRSSQDAMLEAKLYNNIIKDIMEAVKKKRKSVKRK